MATLQQLAPDLWVRSDSLPMLGADFGHRMTVVKLADGSLWIHSPVECSSELVAEVRALGEPRYLVIPSLFHDLYSAEWFPACPGLVGYAPRALVQRKPEKGCTLALEDGPLPWEAEITHVLLGGMPSVQEFDFFHLKSQSLMLADLTFNLEKSQGFRSDWMLRLLGAFGGIRTTRLFRFMVKDQVEFSKSLQRLLALEWTRVIVGHGDVLEGAGVDRFRRHLEMLGARHGS